MLQAKPLLQYKLKGIAETMMEVSGIWEKR